MFLRELICCVLVINVLSLHCGVTPEWEAEVVSAGKAVRGLQPSSALSRNSTLGPLRIVPYYLDISAMSPALLTRVQTIIIPGVISWFSHVLSVYNVNQNLVIPQSTCIYANVPIEHQTTGVPGADFVIYVIATNDYFNKYVARAGACAFDGGNSRGSPIAGMFQYNSVYYDNTVNVENEVSLARHEMSHALGFSGYLFPTYTKPDGTFYDNPVISVQMRGTMVSILATPTVTAKVQSAFNCPTAQGLELEALGGAGTAGSHPASRILFNDYMNGRITAEPIYSDVLLAAFQDSGWYTVNFTFTDQVKFGRGKGCSFLNTTCVVNGVAQFSEFCSAIDGDMCDLYNAEKAQCIVGNWTSPLPTQYQYFSNPLTGGLDLLPDYCPYPLPYSNGDCKGRGAQSTYYDTTYLGEQVGPTSMCFTGTYIAAGWGWVGNPNHASCHNVTCDNGVALVTIGNTTIQCPAAGGQVSNITGYAGYINCPSYSELCGLQVCPNGCFGYGYCSSGTCICLEGYTGIDCSVICDPTCKTCNGTSSNQCLKCFSTAALSKGSCICNPGVTLETSNKCVTDKGCDSSCVTCTGPSATECASCPTDFILDPVSKICHLVCDLSCATCRGSLATECLTCVVNATLTTAGTCECAAGFGFNGTQCMPCDPSCTTCSRVGYRNCTGCQAGAFLPTGQTTGECTCNPGFYMNYTGNYSCEACDVSCKTCYYFPDLCTSCKTPDATGYNCTCSAGFYLSSDGTQCLTCDSSCVTCTGPSATECDSCPTGFILDRVTNICHIECDLSCATCSGGLATQCLTCVVNATMTSTGICECPAGFASNGTQCIPCYPSCTTCSGVGYQNCTGCQAGAFLPTGQTTGECTCNPGFYMNYTGNYSCEACDVSCKTCFGQSQWCSSCKTPDATGYNCTCSAGFYLSSDGTQCLTCDSACATCTGPSATECASCPFGFILDTVSTTCVIVCDLSCATCSGGLATECLTCVVNATMTTAGTCECPAGFSSNGTQCVACDPSCATCFRVAAWGCTGCKDGASLPIGQTTGYCTCNPGFYTTYPDWTCEACDVSCKTCIYYPNVCTSCKTPEATGYYSLCTCSPGFYLSSDGTQCLTCDSSCVTCTGPSATECASCPTDLTLDPVLKSCHIVCDLSCATCSGGLATECLTCVVNATMTTAGTCECPAGFSSNGTQCVACDPSCATCSGVGMWSCTGCKDGAYLPGQTTGYCVCNPGFYWTYPDYTCEACDVSCETCNGRPQWCTSCKTPNATSYYSLCTCSAGFYLSSDGTQCLTCNPSCADCAGPGSSNCTSCPAGLSLSPPSGPGICSPCNYWQYETSFNSCQSCDMSCQTCTGPLSTQCSSCYPWQYSPSPNTCQNCDRTCKTCTGFLPNQCSSCYLGYTFDPATNECLFLCDKLCSTCTATGPGFCSSCIENASIQQGECQCNAGFAPSCLACHPSCATCTGQDVSNCTSCNANAFLPANVLMGPCTCNSGFYMASNFTCGICDISCNTCSSNTAQSCTSCKTSTAIVTEGVCLCPTGFFLSSDGSECAVCDPACLTCSGSSSSQCTGCTSNALLPIGNLIGACTCNFGFYMTPTYTCEACYASCHTCSGNTAQSCTTCKASRALLVEGACICPTGFFLSTDGSLCTACYSACLSCSGAGSNQCTGCNSNAALPSRQVLGTCTCNSGFYMTSSFACGVCDISCKTCSSNTAQSCTACKVSTATINGGACVCPTGFFLSGDGSQCITCDKTCLKCSGTTSSQCTACTLFASLPVGQVVGQCTCNSGYYMTTTFICAVCDISCKTCSANTVQGCTTCKAPTAIVTGGACVCPTGFFLSSDKSQCITCNPTCLTCTGSSANQCSSCKSNAILPNLQQIGICSCIAGFYLTSASTCAACDITCKTCSSNTAQSCLTCKASTATLTGGVCGCPSKFFLSSDGSQCAACDPTCITCTGASSSMCTSCIVNTSLPQGQVVGQCTCNSGYYMTPTFICAVCNISCKTCSANTAQSCTTCKAPTAIVTGGACVCPTGFFLSIDKSQCTACSPSCLTCAGASYSDCTSCPVNSALPTGYLIGTCTCISSSYLTSTNTCVACDPSCKRCSSNTAQSCTACKPSTATISGGACVCPTGFFLSGDGSQCAACDSTCLKCSGTASTQCTTCALNASLPLGQVVGQCTCNSGYYLTSTFTCAACNVSCKTCSANTAQSCITCKAPTAIVTGGVCRCPTGFFLSSDKSICTTCYSACATCTGASSSQCTSCTSNATLPSGKLTGLCSCNAGFYMTSTHSCAACDLSCKNCVSNTAKSCTACKPSTATLTGGACVCPTGFFLSSDGSLCTACDSTCLKCSGATSNKCLSCFSQGILTPSPGPGTCGCSAGKYYSGSSGCLACNSSCKSCTGSLNTQCTSCFSGTPLNGKCPARVLTNPDNEEFSESISTRTCGSNYAPLAIVISVLFLGLVATFVVALRDLSKSYEKVNADDSVIGLPTEAKTIAFPESVMGTHFFIGLRVQSPDLTRWMKGLLLTTSLLTEMFVVGAFYWSDTSRTDSVASVWSEYGWTDFSYVFAALIAGLGLSSVLVTLVCYGGRSGKRIGNALVRLGVAIAIGVSALAIGGTVYLSFYLCAEAGGLWAISSLPMFLGEVLVCETLLSTGRSLVSYLL